MMTFDYSMASAYAATSTQTNGSSSSNSGHSSGTSTPPYGGSSGAPGGSTSTASGAFSANGSSAATSALMAAAASPLPNASSTSNSNANSSSNAPARNASYYTNIATGGLAYKEYLFHSSASINIEMNVALKRIELPLSMCLNAGYHTTTSNTTANTTSSSNTTSTTATTRTCSMLSEVFVEAWLMCNQVPAHSYPIRSQLGVLDVHRGVVQFDYVFVFPIKYRDLSRDACIQIRVYTTVPRMDSLSTSTSTTSTSTNTTTPTTTASTSTSTLLGTTSMPLFDGRKGVLASGRQKLLLFFTDFNKTSSSTTTNNNTSTNSTAITTSTSSTYAALGASFMGPGAALYSEEFASNDVAFQLEKSIERFRVSMDETIIRSSGNSTSSTSTGANPNAPTTTSSTSTSRTDWLDRLTLKAVQSTLHAEQLISGSSAEDGIYNYFHDHTTTTSTTTTSTAITKTTTTTSSQLPSRHQLLRRYGFVVLEFATTSHPIMHEDNAVGAYEVMPYCPALYYDMLMAPGNCMVENDRGVFEFSLQDRVFSGLSLCVVTDWDGDLDTNSPAEELYRKLTHDAIRGASDPSIKPNLQEKERLDAIISSPRDNNLKGSEIDLMYKFRYSLTENRHALTKFLLCLDWTSQSEVAELPSLLALWKEKAPIEVSAALKLLSGGKAFSYPLVRKYAVEVLESANDSELLILLLQLVQALRYEPNLEGVVATSGASPWNTALINSTTANATPTATGGGSPSKLDDANPTNKGTISQLGLSTSQLYANSEVTSRLSTLTPSSSSAAAASAYMRSGDDVIKEQKFWVKAILESSPLAAFLIRRACASYAVANYLYWYLKVEIGDATSGQMFQAVLTCFLMQLELGEDRVVPQSSNVGGAGGSSSASSSDASAINAGTEVTSGTTTTTTSMDTRHMLRELLAQDEYVATISKFQRAAREEKGKKEAKEQALQRLLAAGHLDRVPNALVSVPLPLNPDVQVLGLQPEKTFMFKSAMYPAVIQFHTQPTSKVHAMLNSNSSATCTASGTTSGGVTSSSGTDGETDGSRASVPRGGVAVPPASPNSNANATAASATIDSTTSSTTATTAPTAAGPVDTYTALMSSAQALRVIFKSGDDLRQDQLIMQMFNLMDSLLKKVNMDLKLLTYGIMATGQTDGLMEFVAGSNEISAVLTKHGSLLNFLRHHNADKNGPYGVQAKCLDMFTRSCAGSCVVTYLMGIGDRHLENIMVTNGGQLFHIDFGFIFGRDPKPLPPPFRLTKAMVEAMGGPDSEFYHRFKSYCCQAYNWLRKSALLILNLLSLMRDANIPDISKHSHPDEVLKRVEERFRLDLTDAEAEQFFLSMISDVLNAIAPRIMDFAHSIAVARR